MKIRLLFFSVLRDITGSDEVEWNWRQGLTIAELLAEVFDRWPALEAWNSSLLLAINCNYVKRDEVIPAESEVAFMPPVQGG